MTITDPGGFPNSLRDIMQWLGMEPEEFWPWWKGLTPSEQVAFRVLKMK